MVNLGIGESIFLNQLSDVGRRCCTQRNDREKKKKQEPHGGDVKGVLGNGKFFYKKPMRKSQCLVFKK